MQSSIFSSSTRSIQAEVEDIFDEIQHPNIAYIGDYHDPTNKTKNFVYLKEKYKLPINEVDSIQIIKDVLQGIVEIQSHLLIFKPCQVFKEHIIFKDGRWGICNIICYRDPTQSMTKNEFRYWPIDYQQHENQDSELAWSIGRMWFELITNKEIPPIKNLNQSSLNKIIDNSQIKDLRIMNILKKILLLDKEERFYLKDIIAHQLFQFPELSKIKMHSMIPTFESNRPMINVSQGYNLDTESNPFEEELFIRDFKESIVIADLMENVKKWISSNYEIKGQNDEIDFSCYLIDLKSYLRLKNLEHIRETRNYRLVLLNDKKDYKRFLEKKMELESKVNRKRKMKKFARFKQIYPKCLCELSGIEEDSVHQNYKSYLTSYVDSLRQKRIKSNPKPESFIRLIQILMIRCIDYLFRSCRNYIFSDFTEKDGPLQLDKVIHQIQICKDTEKLKQLQRKILDLYFGKKS